jgi:flavin reductase (DIM6/NTAB) family NADH-FMN oxidoreductase RutF
MDLNALFKISYGIYIVSTASEGRANGFLANTVCQVNSEPPTFQVIVNKKNFTHDLIMKSGLFSVSILSQETPLPFIGQFGFKTGKDFDKLQGVSVKLAAKGTPVVTDNSIAYMVCEVFQKVDVTSHTIFIGNLLECETLSEGIPMTYAYYREVKKGTTAKNAPTYINPDNLQKKG